MGPLFGAAQLQWKHHPAGRLREAFPPTSPNYDSRGTLSTSGFDLLQRLLSLNPAQRISAAEALEHPWRANPSPLNLRSLLQRCMHCRHHAGMHMPDHPTCCSACMPPLRMLMTLWIIHAGMHMQEHKHDAAAPAVLLVMRLRSCGDHCAGSGRCRCRSRRT